MIEYTRRTQALRAVSHGTKLRKELVEQSGLFPSTYSRSTAIFLTEPIESQDRRSRRNKYSRDKGLKDLFRIQLIYNSV